MLKMIPDNWKRYSLEFFSIFIAVISAFALNHWNENRKDGVAELKILIEISNGLEKDLNDVQGNITGHEKGIMACRYWRRIVLNQAEKLDSLQWYYITLTRDFVMIQNTSGYETLKSRGLELIKNDSLRTLIVSLYEHDYMILKKLEEDYHELQFHKNYFQRMNDWMAPSFQFDENGYLINLDLPIPLSESRRKVLLSYLMKIQFNRTFMLQFYRQVEERIRELRKGIEQELRR